MLSRSFSVPKDTVDLDLIGDVSMRSGDGGADGEGGAGMDEGGDEEAPEADEMQGGGEDESEGNEEGEDGESDDDGDDDSEAEPEEEEVMVPVADILNAAFGLDNVSQDAHHRVRVLNFCRPIYRSRMDAVT